MGRLVDIDYNPFEESKPKGKLVDVDYNPMEDTESASARAGRLSAVNPDPNLDDNDWEEVKAIDYLK